MILYWTRYSTGNQWSWSSTGVICLCFCVPVRMHVAVLWTCWTFCSDVVGTPIKSPLQWPSCEKTKAWMSFSVVSWVRHCLMSAMFLRWTMSTCLTEVLDVGVHVEGMVHHYPQVPCSGDCSSLWQAHCNVGDCNMLTKPWGTDNTINDNNINNNKWFIELKYRSPRAEELLFTRIRIVL